MRPSAGLLIITLLLLTAAPARGQRTPILWVGGSAGYGTYAMSDLNDGIERANLLMQMNMGAVGDGFAFCIQAGVQVTSRVGFFGGYERLTASTDFSNAFYRVDLNLPANALFVGAQYCLPYGETLSFGFAGSLGHVSVDGSERVEVGGREVQECDISGSDLFLHGQLFSELRFAERVIFSPALGYRRAKIGDHTRCSETQRNEDGSEMDLDYSGMTLRTSVKVILN